MIKLIVSLFLLVTCWWIIIPAALFLLIAWWIIIPVMVVCLSIFTEAFSKEKRTPKHRR